MRKKRKAAKPKKRKDAEDEQEERSLDEIVGALLKVKPQKRNKSK